MRSRPAALLLAVVFIPLGGCGTDEPPAGPSSESPETTTATDRHPETIPRDEAASRAVDRLEAPPCPQSASNCERAEGAILYVERVDPDGDGDAHFVLAGGNDITGPGISVIDVRADLRPDPLPGPGDRLAASGPVFEGSYGQRQIQADRIVVDRTRAPQGR